MDHKRKLWNSTPQQLTYDGTRFYCVLQDLAKILMCDLRFIMVLIDQVPVYGDVRRDVGWDTAESEDDCLELVMLAGSN